jgi:hypothetical protein
MKSGFCKSPCGIVLADALSVPAYFMILNPCFVPTDAPLGVISPPVSPAADALAYPTSSTLKVFLLPPAFQAHAT